MLPPDPSTRFAEACQRHLAGDLAGAEAGHTAVLTIRPRDARALHNLAAVARARGDHALAERHCRATLREAPDDPEILNTLGATLCAQGRVTEAIAAFHRALALRPDADVSLDLANLLQETGDPDAALAVLRAAMTQAPADHRLRPAALRPACGGGLPRHAGHPPGGRGAA